MADTLPSMDEQIMRTLGAKSPLHASYMASECIAHMVSFPYFSLKTSPLNDEQVVLASQESPCKSLGMTSNFVIFLHIHIIIGEF